MGNLKKSDLIEAVFWLALAGIFFAVTYDFNQPIEIYKFGATGWPRTILLLMALVALGNVFYTLRHGGKALKSRVGASEEPDQIEYRGLRDYLKTGFILLLPFCLCDLAKTRGVLRRNTSVHCADYAGLGRTQTGLYSGQHSGDLYLIDPAVHGGVKRTPAARQCFPVLRYQRVYAENQNPTRSTVLRVAHA